MKDENNTSKTCSLGGNKQQTTTVIITMKDKNNNDNIDMNNNDIVYINNDSIDNINHIQILTNNVYNKNKYKLKLNTVHPQMGGYCWRISSVHFNRMNFMINNIINTSQIKHIHSVVQHKWSNNFYITNRRKDEAVHCGLFFVLLLFLRSFCCVMDLIYLLHNCWFHWMLLCILIMDHQWSYNRIIKMK